MGRWSEGSWSVFLPLYEVYEDIYLILVPTHRGHLTLYCKVPKIYLTVHACCTHHILPIIL